MTGPEKAGGEREVASLGRVEMKEASPKGLASSGADEARARLAAGKRAIYDPSGLPSVGQLPYDRGA